MDRASSLADRVPPGRKIQRERKGQEVGIEQGVPCGAAGEVHSFRRDAARGLVEAACLVPAGCERMVDLSRVGNGEGPAAFGQADDEALERHCFLLRTRPEYPYVPVRRYW